MLHYTKMIKEFVDQNGWDALFARGIEQRDYPEFNLKVLNYSQIDARKDDSIANFCRSLVVDYGGNIVSRSFTRFFNYGEMNTKDFDFSNADVFEKADGSLVGVAWYPQTDKWEIRTRGTAFAEANHVFGLKTDLTFRQAILEAMGKTEQEFQSMMNSVEFHKSCTYVFEYISPFNRVVTPYSEPMVVLLAVISNVTGYEANISGLNEWAAIFKEHGLNVRTAKVYQAFSADQIVKMAESLDGLQEGFVCRNRVTGARVKVKSSVYVNVHHLRGNGTPSANALMELVVKNETEELLTYFPEFKVFVDPIVLSLCELLDDATEVFETNKHFESQKDFALAVKDHDVAPICFKARKDGVSAYDAFHSMDVNQQVKLLERYVGGV